MDNNFKRYNEAADILKALAHPVRLCIVQGLLRKGYCNVGYMQECLELPQSTVSQHLQKLRSFGIEIEDQFGPTTIDVKKPTHLCVNANKKGEGYADLTQNLMCYKVVITPGTPAQQVPPLIYTRDQFGPDAYGVYGPREFCVPTEIVTIP